MRRACLFRDKRCRYTAHHVVAQLPAEGGLDHLLQLGRHLLRLEEQVDEELCHVLLLARVERLVLHGVSLAEGDGIVGLPLAFQEVGKHPPELVERGKVLAKGEVRVGVQTVVPEDTRPDGRDHEELLDAGGHLAGGTQVEEAHQAAV